MKKLLITISALILLGCIGCTNKSKLIIHLKEKTQTMQNLKGDVCTSSGMDIHNYKIVSYYDNCEIVIIRTLETYEHKQWILDNEGNMIK